MNATSPEPNRVEPLAPRRSLPPGATLDSLLTLQEAANWLGLHPRILASKIKGRRPHVPVWNPNQQIIRFHPRTILAKFAADAGVPLEVVAASFGRAGDPGGAS